MDKKNTMLLTVIAVATLLVAVVGATFAYFSVSQQNSSKTVNVTGQTTDVGAATLTTPVTAMHINLTGTQMAEDAQGAKYYSATGSEAYLTAATPATIAKLAVTGGDSKLTYTCNYTLTISKGSTDTMIAKLAEGDGSLVIAGDTITTDDTDFDLTELASGNLTVNGTATALSTAKEEVVTAYVQINNTTAEQGFAGTNLAVEISATTFNCQINE